MLLILLLAVIGHLKKESHLEYLEKMGTGERRMRLKYFANTDQNKIALFNWEVVLMMPYFKRIRSNEITNELRRIGKKTLILSSVYALLCFMMIISLFFYDYKLLYLKNFNIDIN